MCPNWGPGPQPRHVPWLGIQPANLWFTGQHSIHWATQARAIYLFLERGKRKEKERERNIDVREKHQSVASCTCPDRPGTEPSTQACALTGNWTSDLLLCGTSNQLSHTNQDSHPYFKEKYLWPREISCCAFLSLGCPLINNYCFLLSKCSWLVTWETIRFCLKGFYNLAGKKMSISFFPPALLRCNWHITLYKFEVYDVMTWYIYIYVYC